MAAALSGKPLISASRLIHRKTKRTGMGTSSGLVLPRARRIRAVFPLHRRRTVRCDERAFWLVGLDPALAETALQLRDSAGVAPDFPRLVTRIRLSGQYRAAPTLCRRANRVPFAFGYRDRVFAWA